MNPGDIAIIGLACRFPAAPGPGEFWQVLRDGRETAGPMAGSADFDAEFFDISPREAAAMDPRQRLALELAWELLEDAFIVPETVRARQVSVYLGAMNDDYSSLTLRNATENVDHYSFAGVSRAMIANRVSYAFALHGPSMTVDSGQSSSLVAVHLACESLRAGTSEQAIAGGVHLNVASETALLEREFGAVSTSGHTYAFDGRADGYVRGEGGGLVLLKPLHAALADGNRIRAVIVGSAVGNAGHSSAGLTAPSTSAEADVIRRALAQAGVDCTGVDYVEAHGTGTRIGDPAEAAALGQIFAQRRHDPVRVGSVKTNIGHAGAAAGIAGLIKTVLAIENESIPASLNYVSASSAINVESLGLQVNTVPAGWPDWGRPRRAGVSSFGMGGTNAHLLLQQAPATESAAMPRVNKSTGLPWVLSARSAPALANQVQRLLARMDERPDLDAVDVGWSLVSTRSVFEHRAVVVGSGRAQLLSGLAGLAAGEPGAGVAVGRAQRVGKTAFVFPGQGVQYLGMGRGLCERFPVFGKAFDAAAEALDEHLRLPLRRVLWGTDAAVLQNTEFAQPALFAVEVALAALLAEMGVVPDIVLGHSVGEIAAAQVAGVLSLPDAARVVAVRARLMAGLPAGGAMVAVAASEDEVASVLAPGVEIAAVNAPDSVVISGPELAVNAVADRLAGTGRRVRRLAVSHAFHSASMEPMLAGFGAALAGLPVSRPRITLVSNVTGRVVGADYGSAAYWVEHVRKPVRLAEGILLAESSGATTFLEVGPCAGLTTSPALLAKDHPEAESLLTAMGQLFTEGVSMDWPKAFAGLGARPVELPTYGFARQRFWLGEGTRHDIEHAGRSTLWHHWNELDPAERHRLLLDLVCRNAAAVLGDSSSRRIDTGRAFEDVGFESMTGIELRNRLAAATGLTLSRTLIFDYPTPTAVARHLGERLSSSGLDEPGDEQVWPLLRSIPLRELRRTGLLGKLLVLAGQAENTVRESTVTEDVIDALSPDALVAMALEPSDDNSLQ
ncbi:type I polyketide synthase [Mycobacterium kansasii]|uniref:Phenolphthiocerol synthesis polyketide synthase type I Pks15/1 n=3 Tax=Mycobacterium kansasii TaxID=1768 RepID=A0A653F094_MYCKA|nr:type I polyketide synthase [Mycobacterium kansasii]ETZ98372.1 phenolphthiocerol synthesis polyketide synthase type I Pks15/1 [Mycobacterium kansasii 824]AGZ53763.1 polyketide synthase [Mycobacterium kansasii ATCC 12478]ARG60107.1 polyketide synthase [Mycobacterium kansasii]ARG83129.1 polyketide synthase [Mycobacterium kansasii]ARG95221.1 polyketide synthase [Mycobacterium kansasii]